MKLMMTGLASSSVRPDRRQRCPWRQSPGRSGSSDRNFTGRVLRHSAEERDAGAKSHAHFLIPPGKIGRDL